MKKMSLMVGACLSFFIQGSVMAMLEEEQNNLQSISPKAKKKDRLMYEQVVSRLERRVNNIERPSDLALIRKTATLALSLQPEEITGDPYGLQIYAAFGKGNSMETFLRSIRKINRLINKGASEEEIRTKVTAVLILTPPNISPLDFKKYIKPLLYRK